MIICFDVVLLCDVAGERRGADQATLRHCHAFGGGHSHLPVQYVSLPRCWSVRGYHLFPSSMMRIHACSFLLNNHLAVFASSRTHARSKEYLPRLSTRTPLAALTSHPLEENQVILQTVRSIGLEMKHVAIAALETKRFSIFLCVCVNLPQVRQRLFPKLEPRTD